MSAKQIANAMHDLKWETNCTREQTEGWYAKDCRELKLKRKCHRCNLLIRVQKLMEARA